MNRRAAIAIALLQAAAIARAAEPEPNLVPRPAALERHAGSFNLSSTTALVVAPDDPAAATAAEARRLADLAGAPEREMPAPLDWASLVRSLEGELGSWAASDRVKVAVNSTLVADKTSLTASDGDEVALLPPVSGG